jgi:hypothetical protein
VQILYRTVFALWLTSCSLFAAGQTISQQIEAIEIQRQGLLNLMRYVDQTPDIFNRSQQSNLLLNRTEKEEILDVWVLYLDYMSTLSILADQTEDYLRLSGKNREEKKHVHALAFNAHYRFGLEFIDRLHDDPEIRKWLNRVHPDQGLEKNLYRKFSQQILSDWSTDLFDDFNQSFSLNPALKLSAELAKDQAAIRNLNRFSLLTSNSTHRIRRSLYNTYYPVQKGVARGMGKVKVWRIGNTLITPEQALEFSYQFEPGDFYLTRKEWRLTNVGIPGFWTHSAIFIGTPAERALYFDTPEVNDWVESQGARSFEDLLKQASDIYAAHPGRDANGDIRVIEALDAGVIFNSIETSLDADGAAVFRPMTTKLEKAKAIYNSFYYTGQPYDFHFDFDSDDAIVCSELIFKSYQASESQTGIPFPLNKAVGKKMLTPSEIAQWYDDTVGTPEQKIDLVMFIDSNEKDGVAFQSTREAFIGSWKRPDWYLFQQPKRQSDQIAAN